MHIGIIGVGRVGKAIAYTLIHEHYVTELSLVDIIPNLTKTFAEEIRHVTASLGKDIMINAYERSSDVSGADIVLITAGKPRTADMTRRDLVFTNAKVMKSIAEEIFPNNKKARYVIIANPVDAMATLFKKLTKADYVISSGTHLDTLRFRVELAKALNVPISSVETYVAGEHGPNSVFLWSLTKIDGVPFNDFAAKRRLNVGKREIELRVKEISREIIAVLGGTCYGPAAAFRDIVRAIALNTGRVLSVATPLKIPGVPTEVMVSVPQRVGRTLGYTLLSYLTEEERNQIYRAGRAIYETYTEAIKLLSQK